MEGDVDCCTVDNWKNNYAKVDYCATSIQGAIRKHYKGLIECHLVKGEVWLIKTSALQKVE
jgi:hypothetical protein